METVPAEDDAMIDTSQKLIMIPLDDNLVTGPTDTETETADDIQQDGDETLALEDEMSDEQQLAQENEREVWPKTICPTVCCVFYIFSYFASIFRTDS